MSFWAGPRVSLLLHVRMSACRSGRGGRAIENVRQSEPLQRWKFLRRRTPFGLNWDPYVEKPPHAQEGLRARGLGPFCVRERETEKIHFQWHVRKYERQMFYFNTHRRIAKYKHSHADYFRRGDMELLDQRRTARCNLG